MCSQQLRNGLVVIRLRQRQAIALAQGSDRGVAIDGEVAEVTSRQRLRRQLQRFEDTVECIELALRGEQRDIVMRLQIAPLTGMQEPAAARDEDQDRKSVGQGKRGAEREEHGGVRMVKEKNR